MRKFLPFILVFTLYFLVKAILFLPLTVVNGTVINIGKYTDTSTGHRTVTFYPIVVFTNNSIADTTTDTDPGSFFYSYKIGDNVRVCYKSNHPEQARLYSFFTWWLPIGNLGALILACIAWVGISRIFSKKLDD